MEFANLDLTKTYTYADYCQWNFDNRVELIGGKVYEMMTSPLVVHQELIGKMYVKLFNF